MVRIRAGSRKISILLKLYISSERSKGKAISVQAWTDLAGSRRFRLPDFKTVRT